MNQSIEAITSWIAHPQIASMLMVMLAIMVLLIGRIMSIASTALFICCNLFIAGAFFSTIFLSSSPAPAINGMSLSAISLMGIQIGLPVVMALSFMMYAKPIDHYRKIDALLLLLISFLGGITVMVSTNWMVFFVALQCLSLPVFGLLALDTNRSAAISSSTRYLLQSSVAMAIMLFGIALLYAETGHLDFVTQAQAISSLSPSSWGLASFGLGLILVGLGFKLSIAPFHVWTAEVYHGASFFVLGYLSIIAKAVVIFFVMHNGWLLFGMKSTLLITTLSTLAVLSMWVGNGLMVLETNVMRFLAFLSIGHLGFLLIPLLSPHPLSMMAVVVDVIAFALAMLLLLATLKMVYPSHELSLSDLKGLGSKNPGAALLIALSLASLAGVPLTAGFVAKYSIFMSGALTDQWVLLTNMALSSILPLFALLRVIVGMYQAHDTTPHKTMLPWPGNIVFLAALAILALGIAPNQWLAWVNNSLNSTEISAQRASLSNNVWYALGLNNTLASD